MDIAHFSEAQTQQVSLSGGKGANLARLTAMGFDVPPGIVVPADVYRAFIAQADWLPALVAGLDFDHPQQLLTQTQALVSRLGQLDLPRELAPALEQALAQLPEQVSVRSSATAEDTAAAAFAGQHDTFLNVPRAQVADRVRACWLSLWSDRALLYRRQAGIALFDTAMAVVVQAMVQADAAGVAFSVDPVAGDLGCIVVDANYGLGESVVSGEAEVDHWSLDKASLAVRQARIADKTLKIVSLADGGTETVQLSGQQRRQAVLSDEQLQSLAQLVKAVEKAYGFPQDVEWALSGGRFYLLQSRPVTSIAPHWTREESAERFPNPISPLAWDLTEAGFHRSLNHSFDLMGLPPFEGKWFAMFDSYIYGDQNAVELYANGVPLSIASVADLERALPEIRQRYGWVQELPTRWARDLDWYLLQLGELKAVALGSLSLRQVWDHVLRVRDVGAHYFLPNIAISITQRVLYKVLHGMLSLAVGPSQAQELFDALLAHCDTKTGLINQELYRLAAQLRDHSAFFAAHGNEQLLDPASGVLSDLVQRQLPEFATGFARLLAEHGHREVEFDPYVATWAEAPTVVLDTLRVMAMGELHNPRQRERELKVRAQETLFTLQARVPESLRYFFTEVVRLAQVYTSLDDLEHYQTTRLTLPLRRGLRELGARLVDLGIFEQPMDVFFARFATLDRVVRHPSPAGWTELAHQVAENKAIYDQARQRDPIWNLGDTTAPTAARADGNQWPGIAGSPGCARGPVFLVHGPEDFGRFPKGAVLVARTTNPAWTPLFYGASAVITESGGPLSHGAVTAREMGKPAVMGVRGIMADLKNGDLVEVNGSRGLVSGITQLDTAADADAAA